MALWNCVPVINIQSGVVNWAAYLESAFVFWVAQARIGTGIGIGAGPGIGLGFGSYLSGDPDSEVTTTTTITTITTLQLLQIRQRMIPCSKL